jgi:hypothetical protein
LPGWPSEAPVSSGKARKRPELSASPAGSSIEFTTEGVRAKRIGIMHVTRDPSRAARMGGTCAARADLVLFRCRGASAKQSPDPCEGDRESRLRHMLKLGWRGSARRLTPPGVAVEGPLGRKPRKAASSRGDGSTMLPGFKAIWGCARGSYRFRRSRRRCTAKHRESEQRWARRRWKALWTEEERRL